MNGDLLSFIVKSQNEERDEVVARVLDPSFGPVITSAIRLGDVLDGKGDDGRGFYVEDGGNLYLLSWMLELSGLPSFLWRFLRFLKISLKYRWGLRPDTDLGAEIAALIGPSVTSSSSMPVLTMGRDYPNGNLSYDGRYLDCDWQIKKSQAYYDRIIRVVRGLASELNAKYMDNHSYKRNFHKVITVHPLGGCPMGLSEDEGVVNAYGEVFGCPGLYIADGSLMPGPVGPNPALTIAALADHFAEHIVAPARH